MTLTKDLNFQGNIQCSSSIVAFCSVYSQNLKLYSSKYLILRAKCIKYLLIFRSGHADVLCRKGVLRNFANFIGKHLCQSLCFNKVAGLTLLKQRLWHKHFPVTLAKFLRAPFLTENLRWLLLYMTILVNLLLILKICLFVEIKFWNTPLRISLKNPSFQDKYLWRSSILVKALCLRFTVILLMILKLMVLRDFVIILSALTVFLFFLVTIFLTFHSVYCTGL